MHKRGIVLMICCMVLVSCTAAFAQQKGQKGITLGLPGSVGFVWHVSDSFAIRPEASVSFMSGHSNPTEVNEFLVDPVSASSSGSAWGLGASALFYVHRKDAVSLYLSPRFTYSRTSTTSESSSAGLTRTTEITTSVYSGSASFGVQYALSSRFSLFGELGIVYSDQRNSASYSGLPVASGETSSTARTWGTRTGIGAAIYF